MRICRCALLLALSLPIAARGGAPADLELAPFASGLSSPLAVRHAPDGSGRVYVVQRDGIIRGFAQDGSPSGTLLSFAANPPPQGFSTGNGGDERGLLGLAFHPDFPADPRLFVNYTDGNSDTVVASYTASGNPLVANPASATIVLRVDQDSNNHNGGDVHFGADGYLYIGMGDGGGANDACNRAQTLDPADLELGSCPADGSFMGNNPESLALLGKMLRIDVDGSTAAGHPGTCGGNADGSAAYAIPPTNPFAGGGTANGCDEVWHYGLRNPYRFSFDRQTGGMYIGDVGQSAWEEVDYSAADQGGLNFGWRVCEGRFVRGSTTTPCSLAGATPPILDYGRSGGACAVTGGYVYRGPISALQGDYIYADYCNGRISIASFTGLGWSSTLWQDAPYLIAGFGEDEAGNLYLTDFFGGRVLRFEVPVQVVAEDDSFDLLEDAAPTLLDVLANDGGPAPLTIATMEAALLGTLENLGTALRYTPFPDACGGDGFGYTTSAGASAQVSVQIACVDDGDAVATDDAFDIAANTGAATLDVLANDLPDPDPGQPPLAVVAVTAAEHGSSATGGSHALYTPASGYCGPDTFGYSIPGGASATVHLQVHCEIALDDAFTLQEDAGPTVLSVLANDAGPAPLTIDSVDFGPLNGVVDNAGTHLVYAPAPDWCGSDLIGYTTSAGLSAAAVITVECVEEFLFGDGFEP